MRRFTGLFALSLALSACAAGPSADEVAMRTAGEVRRAEDARYADPANRVAGATGFVFEFGACIRYTFDSARGLLVRDRGFSIDMARPRTVVQRVDSVRVALSAYETRAVVEEANRIGLWATRPSSGTR